MSNSQSNHSRNSGVHQSQRGISGTTPLSKSETNPPYLLPCSLGSHQAYCSCPNQNVPEDPAAEHAFEAFIMQFPQYRLTWMLDTLRRSDYTRLSRTLPDGSRETETYVDYMGGALYPESLIRVHTEFLTSNVLGNTHSISASSQLSLKHVEEARTAVLRFFDAPQSVSEDDSNEYTVVFTSNASGALKLVGEAYQFTRGNSFVLCEDSHNSVNGIREFARREEANVVYIPVDRQANQGGAFNLDEAKSALLKNKPPQGASSLFALTGLSNITNAKCPDASIVTYARTLGYHTILDAAALAPTSRISLAQIPVDALVVSFYKMFGFPTGIGALLVRKGFLRMLKSKRPWFAGGSVEVVQVPGWAYTMKGVGEEPESFEDGTINYLLLPAITSGLRLLSMYLPYLPLRLHCLVHHLISEISQIRHHGGDGDMERGLRVCQVLSRKPTKTLQSLGETDDETGGIITCIFVDEAGKPFPLSFIAHSAAQEGISLRTGCMCNPGGTRALLGIQRSMKFVEDGRLMREDTGSVEFGVVRISLGLGSDWSDVWRVLQWARKVSDAGERREMWGRWMARDGRSTTEDNDV
ncbi:pyridoxal phosphate-dependent transferase [Rhodocollybia butyracea]|uniref:Pyridoxal phosphate-dependent transferase n=1 Tax=Rhodocollybia butyracea TaxID=206335 RepID=A0A9P5PAN1_9AGAR|nr:pyridoxal phosphate-dependent transferase [Rhodocollybia butyracea]